MRQTIEETIDDLQHEYSGYSLLEIEEELNRRMLVKDYVLNGVKRSKSTVKKVFKILIECKKEKGAT